MAVKKRQENRLTYDKLEKIKWLINLDGFYELDKKKKKYLVEKAYYFRRTLEDTWNEYIIENTSESEDIMKYFAKEIIYTRISKPMVIANPLKTKSNRKNKVTTKQ
ncbi:MAG: hypothetical protein LRY73_07555 [Bacillus sp. (in: Bacteria)]|nr:hypothetical protein [Bacillus sp. (in: firmicutes)]